MINLVRNKPIYASFNLVEKAKAVLPTHLYSIYTTNAEKIECDRSHFEATHNLLQKTAIWLQLRSNYIKTIKCLYWVLFLG